MKGEGLKKILLIGSVILSSLNMIAGTNSTYAKPQEQSIGPSEVKFENEFMKLWIDHVIWTSNYIQVPQQKRGSKAGTS